MKKLTCLLISLMSIASSAHASPYLNGGLGYTHWEANHAFIGGKGETSFSDADFSMPFNLGYEFNTYIGVEAGYRAYSNNPIAFLSFNEPFDHLGQNMNAHGSTLSLTGSIPINNYFSFSMKVGSLRWVGDIKPNISSGKSHFTGTDPVYAISLHIKPEKSFSIDYNYEVSQFENINAKLTYLSATWHF